MTGEVLSVVNRAARGHFDSEPDFGVIWTYRKPDNQTLIYEVVIKGMESKRLSLGMRHQE